MMHQDMRSVSEGLPWKIPKSSLASFLLAFVPMTLVPKEYWTLGRYVVALIENGEMDSPEFEFLLALLGKPTIDSLWDRHQMTHSLKRLCKKRFKSKKGKGRLINEEI